MMFILNLKYTRFNMHHMGAKWYLIKRFTKQVHFKLTGKREGVLHAVETFGKQHETNSKNPSNKNINVIMMYSSVL